MALGLFLILIVILPLCIYLYTEVQHLKIEVENLRKKMLETKILDNKEKDTKSLDKLTEEENKQPKINSDKNEYLEEVSNNINKTINTENIKLTEYELKQEEQAIISYQELKKHLKEQSETITPKETEVFIENLKNLRNNLKS